MVQCSGVGDYRGAGETQIPTESSGYHSGSLSKTHKSNSGVIKTSGAKENHQGYNVNYKDPLTQVRLKITEKVKG